MEIDNDDFSIDLEEEFDPLDEQELDVEIDETPIDKPIDDRNPVLMSAKGFSKGAKEYFIDDNNMERILFRSMPSEYRESRNFARDRFKGVKSIYDDAAKELKEPIRQLKRSGREIRKMMGNSIPEVIGKRLDSLLEEGYSRDDGYKGLNQDAIRDNQIASTIADIFHAEQMQQQETISEDRVQRQVEFSVARDQKDLLRSIAQNSFRSLDIQSNITSRYQQKMLEFSIRKYFTLQNILTETVANRKDTIEQLQLIVKNTALPDIVKQQKMELVRDMGFRRLVQIGQETAASKIDRYFEQYTENLRSRVMGSVKELGDVFRMGSDLADGMKAEKDLEDMEREFDPNSESLDKNYKRGKSIFSILDAVGLDDIVGRRIRNLRNNKHVKQGADSLGIILDNKETFVDDFVKRKVPNYFRRKGMENGVLDTVWNFFRETAPNLRETTETVGFHNANNLEKLAEFNNRTQKSITEIIPGYLARILQSVESIRTKENVGRLVFSHERDTFVTEDQIKQDILKNVYDPRNKEYVNKRVDDLTDNLVGKDHTLSEEDIDTLKQYVLKRARDNRGLLVNDFLKEDYYAKEALPEHVRNQIKTHLQSQFNVDEDGTVNYFSKENHEKVKAFSDTASMISRAVPRNVEVVKRLAEGGVSYTDILKSLDLVSKDGWNRHDINKDVVYGGLLNKRNGRARTEEEIKEEILDTSTNDLPPHQGEILEALQTMIEKDQSQVASQIEENTHNVTELIKTITSGKSQNHETVLQLIKEYFDQNTGNAHVSRHVAPVGVRLRQPLRFTQFNETPDGSVSTTPSLQTKTLQAPRNASSSLDLVVFTPSGNQIRLSQEKLKLGEYVDEVSGRVITQFNQIKGNVLDKLGNLIVTKEELSQGIYDITGKQVSQFSLENKLPSLNKETITRTLKQFVPEAKEDESLSDVYVKGSELPVIRKTKLLAGEYLDAAGNVLTKLSDIKDKVFEINQQGILDLVLTEEDIKKGLLVRHGSQFTELSQHVARFSQSVKDAFTRQFNKRNIFLQQLGNASGLLNNAITGSASATFHVGDWVGQQNTNSPNESLPAKETNSTLENIRDKFSAKIQLIDEKMKEWDLKNKILDLKEAPEKYKERLEESKKTTYKREIKINGEVIDPITGKARENSFWDQRREQKEKREKEKASQQDTGKKTYREEKKDSMMTKLFGFGAVLTSGFLSIKQTLESGWGILSTIATSLTGIGKWLKGSLTDLILKRGAISVLDKASDLAGGIGGGSGKGGIVRRTARGAWNATKTAASYTWKGIKTIAPMGVGKYAMAAGSSLVSGAATVAAAIPVWGWAALALFGLGMAAYQIYQFFDDSYKDLDRFRLLAYGVYPEEQRDQANKLLAFEKEVWVNTRVSKGDKVNIDTSKFGEWVALFWNDEVSGPPSEDEYERHLEQASIWWENRFLPVYEKHVKVMRRIQANCELDDIDDDLDDAFKGSFVRLSLFKEDEVNNPYTFNYLPFSDLAESTVTYRDIKEQSDKVSNKYQKSEDKKRSYSRRARDGENNWFFGPSKSDKNSFDFERYFTAPKEITKEDLKGKQMVTMSTTAEVKTEDGRIEKVRVDESLVSGLMVVSDIQIIRYMLYGLKAEDGTQPRIEQLQKIEQHVFEHCKVDPKGTTWSYPLKAHEEAERWMIPMGWNKEDSEQFKAWCDWWEYRFMPTIKACITYSRQLKEGVRLSEIDSVVEPETLYKVAKSMLGVFVTLPNGSWLKIAKVPFSGFKGLQPNLDESSYVEPLRNLEKGVTQRSLLKKPTKEQMDKLYSQAQKDMKDEAARRKNTSYQFKDSDRYKNASQEEISRVKQGAFGKLDQMDPSGMRNGEVEYVGLNAGDQRATPGIAGITASTDLGQVNTVQSNGSTVAGIKYKQPPKEMFRNYNMGNNFPLVKDLLAQVANMVGVDAGILSRVAGAESSFNPYAQASTSSAGGLFQFINDTWKTMLQRGVKEYGLNPNAPKTDAVTNAVLGAMYIKDNMKAIEGAVKAAGRQLSPKSVYLAHFLGTGGARNFYDALAKEPNAPGTKFSVIKRIANANKSIVYHKDGRPRTMLELEQVLGNKLYGNMQDAFAQDTQRAANQKPTQVTDANVGIVQTTPNASNSIGVNGLGNNIQPSQQIRMQTAGIAENNGDMEVGYKQPTTNTPNTLMGSYGLNQVTPPQPTPVQTPNTNGMKEVVSKETDKVLETMFGIRSPSTPSPVEATTQTQSQGLSAFGNMTQSLPGVSQVSSEVDNGQMPPAPSGGRASTAGATPRAIKAAQVIVERIGKDGNGRCATAVRIALQKAGYTMNPKGKNQLSAWMYHKNGILTDSGFTLLGEGLDYKPLIGDIIVWDRYGQGAYDPNGKTGEHHGHIQILTEKGWGSYSIQRTAWPNSDPKVHARSYGKAKCWYYRDTNGVAVTEHNPQPKQPEMSLGTGTQAPVSPTQPTTSSLTTGLASSIQDSINMTQQVTPVNEPQQMSPAMDSTLVNQNKLTQLPPVSSTPDPMTGLNTQQATANQIFQVKLTQDSLRDTNNILAESLKVQQGIQQSVNEILKLAQEKAKVPFSRGQETNPSLVKPQTQEQVPSNTKENDRRLRDATAPVAYWPSLNYN